MSLKVLAGPEREEQERKRREAGERLHADAAAISRLLRFR